MVLTNVIADMQSLIKNVAQLNIKVEIAEKEISDKETAAEEKACEVQENLAKAAATQAEEVADKHRSALSQCRIECETKVSEELARCKDLMEKQSSSHTSEIMAEKDNHKAELESNATEAKNIAVGVAKEVNELHAKEIEAAAQVF
jgi:hypothetical protein